MTRTSQRSTSPLEDALAAVPWAALAGCLESGAPLPPLYRAVASRTSSAKAREKAWRAIWNAVYQDDSVAPASLASIPVLAVLAHRAPTVADRREAAYLAGAIEMWTRARDLAALPIGVRRLFPKARAALREVAQPLLANPRLPSESRILYESSRLALEGKRAAALRLYQSPAADDTDDTDDTSPRS